MKFLVKDNAENQYLFAQDCQQLVTAYSVDEVLPALERIEGFKKKAFIWLAGFLMKPLRLLILDIKL